MNLLRRLIGDWWEVRKCYWPFPEGFATYHPASRTILDTGLSRDAAQDICDKLNKHLEND